MVNIQKTTTAILQNFAPHTQEEMSRNSTALASGLQHRSFQDVSDKVHSLLNATSAVSRLEHLSASLQRMDQTLAYQEGAFQTIIDASTVVRDQLFSTGTPNANSDMLSVAILSALSQIEGALNTKDLNDLYIFGHDVKKAKPVDFRGLTVNDVETEYYKGGTQPTSFAAHKVPFLEVQYAASHPTLSKLIVSLHRLKEAVAGDHSETVGCPVHGNTERTPTEILREIQENISKHLKDIADEMKAGVGFQRKLVEQERKQIDDDILASKESVAELSATDIPETFINLVHGQMRLQSIFNVPFGDIKSLALQAKGKYNEVVKRRICL